MSKKSFDQSKYVNDYIKANYERINLLLPPGYKDRIKKQAAENGLSMSQYIIRLLEHDTSSTVHNVSINVDDLKK
jgi:predicted DNA binding CopG/RHH family protein